MDDAVSVLLQEYGSLRTEVINRTGFGFQLIPVGIALLGLLFVQIRGKWGVRIIFAVGLIAFGLSISANVAGICSVHGRIVELEKEINHRVGEKLLSWEAKRSPGVPIACPNG